MSVFGSKNMGLSDSLINAVKEVGQSGKTIQTNMQRRNQELDEKKHKTAPVTKKDDDGEGMDPVGKGDADIDNDGDSDSTDKYLKKRRQAISKSIKGKGGKKETNGQDQIDVNASMDDMKEAAGSRSIDKQDGETKPIKPGPSHLCATKVEHAEWGVGECIFSEHAEPDENGHVSWYDVLFDHGIEKQVSISEMKVIDEMSHGNHKKKK